MSSPAAKQTGLGNPAFRPEPSGRPGAVGIGKPAGSDMSGQYSRRPGSDDFSSHPDDRDLKEKQTKRMYIIMVVLGVLLLAFLIIAIVMIVLYANEKNKTVPKEVTVGMMEVQPYYFSFVDYNRTFNASTTPSPRDYDTQILNAAKAAFATADIGVGYSHADRTVSILESGTTTYRAVISATVVLIKIRSGTKSSRSKRAAVGFPDVTAFKDQISGKMPKSITSEIGIPPDVADSTMGVCKIFVDPPQVPNEETLANSTTTGRPGSTVSGATAKPATTGTTITTSKTSAVTSSGSCPPCTTASSATSPPCPTVCPTCPTTLATTSCSPCSSGATSTPCPTSCPTCPATPSAMSTVCPTASLTCPVCPPTQSPITPSCPPPPPTNCPTVPPTGTTPNPHTKSTIPPTVATTTAVPDARCKFDLVFIVDESESVGQGPDGSRNWQLIKDSMKSTTDPSILTILPTETRMAWVGFSTSTYTDADQIQLLKNSYNNTQTSKAIDPLYFHPGGSNAYSAFLFTQNTLLTAANGARKDPANFRELIILISDGNYKTWDHPIPASTIAKELRDANNATIFAVSVSETGHNIDPANLLDITGYPDHIYNISNYDQLERTIKQIINSQSCPPPPVDKNCRGDLILVVDRSESVEDENFKNLKTFLVNDFTNQFHVDGEKQYRMAMVTFSDDVKVEFNLDDLTTNAAIANAINSVAYYHPAATNTAGALQAVLNDILNPATYRPIACSGTVIILFTDGIHDVGGDPLVPADRLRNGPTHATVVSVGIGPLVFQPELIGISGSKDLVFNYEDFTHLGTEFVELVNNRTCTPDPVLIKCNDPHDVAIVVDLHKELTADELSSVVKYLNYFTSGFYLDDGQIHLALVTYGSSVVSSTPFRQWTNAELSDYIGTLNKDPISGDPTTGLAAALRLLNSSMHTPRHDTVGFYYPDVITIITTQPTDYSAELGYYADQLLSDRYTTILGIAAGDTYPDHTTAEVLRYIARSEDNVVEFESLLEFDRETCLNNDFTQKIVKLTCEYYPPPPPPPTQCYQVCSDTSPAPTTTYSPTTTPTRGPPPPTRSSGRPPVVTTSTPRPTTSLLTTSTSTSTTTQSTTPTVRWGCLDADLVFVVDVSDSPNTFMNIIKQFVSRLSEQYMANSSNSRVAIGIFSRKYQVVININQSDSWENVNNAIHNNWPLIPSIRDTKLGLQSTIEQILNLDPRPTVPDKVIVVDFGEHQEGDEYTPFTVAETIRNRQRTSIYGFGAQPLVSLRSDDPTVELEQIVNNLDHVKTFPNMNALDQADIRSLLEILGCGHI